LQLIQRPKTKKFTPTFNYAYPLCNDSRLAQTESKKERQGDRERKRERENRQGLKILNIIK